MKKAQPHLPASCNDNCLHQTPRLSCYYPSSLPKSALKTGNNRRVKCIHLKSITNGNVSKASSRSNTKAVKKQREEHSLFNTYRNKNYRTCLKREQKDPVIYSSCVHTKPYGLVHHPVLTMANQLPMASLQASPGCKSTPHSSWSKLY